eukprot:gene5653-8958_t
MAILAYLRQGQQACFQEQTSPTSSTEKILDLMEQEPVLSVLLGVNGAKLGLAVHSQTTNKLIDYIYTHAKQLMSIKPLFVHGHFLFFDITSEASNRRGQIPATVYINMLRHPVTKLVSHFQYLQSTYRGAKRQHSGLFFDPNVSLDECIAAISTTPPYKPAWESPVNNTLPCDTTFFLRSVQNIEPGLSIAKRNLQDRFAFVGLLEETQLSYRALETMFPSFFGRGDGDVIPQAAWDGVANKNPEKYRTKRQTRRFLSSWSELSGDMDFYHFAASLFWDKITCLISTQWRAGHNLDDLRVLSVE